MNSVLLIYPYFNPRRDYSVFRFPPLGISYVASRLLQEGYNVRILDCTFLDRESALKEAKLSKADVVGIYCMVTMVDDCMRFARELRPSTRLLIAGGPLPTCEPRIFLDDFDVAVRGEGEETMAELLAAFEKGTAFDTVLGIAFKKSVLEVGTGKLEKVLCTAERPKISDLDSIPFPARSQLPNTSYMRYGKKRYGYSITTIMTTRGCPFACEFCSNGVFGASYRARSAENVVDEIEEVLRLGYDRVSFSDDVFTLKKDRLLAICREIRQRRLNFKWECLSRVDAMSFDIASEMKEAGCARIYFGIESGNERILKLMNKNITLEQARLAVEAVHQAGLEAGAFFIIGYPGETDETILDTLRFSSSLPLDYLGLTMPFPLPGANLQKRILSQFHWQSPVNGSPWGSSVPVFDAQFSKTKMRFAILKGQVQHKIIKRMGMLAPLFLIPFQKPTDLLFRLLR